MAKVLVSQKEFIVITNDKLFELNIISGNLMKNCLVTIFDF